MSISEVRIQKSVTRLSIIGGVLVVIVAMAVYLTRLPQTQPDLLLGTRSVELKPNEVDAEKTNVYLRDGELDGGAMLLTIPDVYREHYHPAEFHNGFLYIIRRVSAQDGTDGLDELWRYDQAGREKRLFTGKGLDFRVSPQAKQIVLVVSSQDEPLVVTDLEGVIQKTFQRGDVPRLTADEFVRPLVFLESAMWLMAVQGLQIQVILSLEMPSNEMTSYDISDLQVTQADFALEPTTRAIAYTNFRSPLEQGGEPQAVRLEVYELATGERLTLLNSTTTKPLNPQWVTPTTIEYDDPNDAGRVTIRVSR